VGRDIANISARSVISSLRWRICSAACPVGLVGRGNAGEMVTPGGGRFGCAGECGKPEAAEPRKLRAEIPELGPANETSHAA
jgi:hypothetical protein